MGLNMLSRLSCIIELFNQLLSDMCLSDIPVFNCM